MRQMSALWSTYTELNPVSSVNGATFIEFNYVGSELFVDPSDTLLELKLKVVQGDNKSLDADMEGSVINSLLDTLFKNVSLTINGTHVESSNFNHGYKAILRHLLMFGTSAKDNQLRLLGYSKDKAGEMEGGAEKTGGYLTRKTWLARSRTLQLIGPPAVDFFLSNPRLLIPFTDFSLKFTLNSNDFIILDHTNKALKVLVEDARLHVRCIRANPDVSIQTEENLKVNNAIYPLERLTVQTHTVARGATSDTISGLYGQQKPKCVVVGMVEGKAYSGDKTKNPFNFKHYDLVSLSLASNGQTLVGRPYTPNFAANTYAREYAMLYQGLRKLARDTDIDISYEDFENGYALFMFNLAGDNAPPSGSGHAQPLERGNLTLNMLFKTALPESINVVLFAFFDSAIQIDRDRRVTTDFDS
jgi:hypothetical protein